MAGRMNMIKSTKGFYSLEAAIFLPLVILAVLSLGYFMKVSGAWENCIHGAVDESALIASKSYDAANAAAVGVKVNKRIREGNPELASAQVKNLRIMYSDGYADKLTSYKVEAAMRLELPLGFSGDFKMDCGIKYRGFAGVEEQLNPMGKEALQRYEQENPVWVFPYSGERYHKESCTYVKASAAPAVLTAALEKNYESCGLCESESVPHGSIVFCFSKSGTAYHRGTCSSIVRRVLLLDRSEAIKKGYTPCAKCGGG